MPLKASQPLDLDHDQWLWPSKCEQDCSEACLETPHVSRYVKVRGGVAR